jgi:prepilin-type N-terminal cleavage/methylation domain-containing protein
MNDVRAGLRMGPNNFFKFFCLGFRSSYLERMNAPMIYWRTKKNNMSNQKAFTLVELMVVVALVVTVMAIATPSFQRFAINGNLKGAARDIASDVALLRERALAENRLYRISLNVAGGSYTLQQCNAPGSPCAAWTPIQIKNFMGFASDINFDSGSTTVTDYSFQPRGIVTSGTIALRNGRGSMGTITISASGRQNVQFNLH